MDNVDKNQNLGKEKNIEELRELEEKLSIDKFFDKITVVGAMIGKIILDENGKPYDFQILKVNPGLERLTGLSKEELVSKTGLEVFSKGKESWNDMLKQVLIENKLIELSFYSEALRRFFIVNVFSIQKGIIMAIFTDVTKIKEQQDGLEKVYELQKAMNSVRTILIKANNEKTLYQKICDALTQVSFIKIAGVFLVQDENSPLNIAAFSAPDEYRDYIAKNVKVYLNPPGGGTFRTALKIGEPVVIDNVMKDKRVSYYRKHYSKLNIKSLITLPLKLEGNILGVLALYSDKERAFGRKEILILDELSTDIYIGVNTIKLKKALMENNKKLEEAISDILIVLSKIVDSKDPFTAAHQKRVAQLSVAIAKKLGLPKNKVKLVELGALVHDIGKIYVPIEILVKPGKLTENEFNIIKEHPQTGYKLLKDLISPFNILAQIALQHHERLDGSGYPQGLKDDETLFEAKIVAVADVVEAMSSHRPYRPALGVDKALEEISRGKGKLYNPEVVDACIKVLKEDGFKFD